MDAILTIVLFAAAGLFLLFVYDKRSSLVTFFKQKVFKPRPVKLPKIKEPKDITKEVKKPGEVQAENLSFGEFKMPEDKPKVAQEESFFGNTVFLQEEFEDDEEDFDIDKMLAEIEEERRETSVKNYASDLFGTNNLPDFDSMSINDLDSLLEESIDSGYEGYNEYLPSYDDDLSGEELGEVIKSLPKSIKILIMDDIFKRKF